MSVPPPKLKAFVTAIKEQVVEAEGITWKQCFESLMKLELAQRGFLLDDDAAGTSKLFGAIQSTAGKALLSEASSYPKPLLAGSAGIAGRLAERTAIFLRQDSSDTPTSNALGASMTDMETAKRRCRDVDETRLLALLELADHISISALWVVAEGYYYRAASFQDDVPLYWKKAWDVVTEYSHSDRTWQSAYCVEELKRVANSKNNTKRVAELNLKLSHMYLDQAANPSGVSSTIWKAFCEPHRSIKPLNRPLALEMVQNSLKATGDQSSLEVQIVLVELALAQEVQAIQELVETEQGKAQRRSQKSLSTTDLQRQYLAKQPCTWDCAATLRDAALSNTANTQTAESQFLEQAWKLLGSLLVRCRNWGRARAVETSDLEAWKLVQGFVSPLWEYWIHQPNDVSASSNIEEEVQRAAFLLAPCIAWMSFGHRETGDTTISCPVSVSVLSKTKSVLQRLLEKCQAKIAESTSKTVSAAGTSENEREAWTLQTALVSTQGLCLLHLEEAEDQKMQSFVESILTLTKVKKQQSTSFHEETASEYGTFCLALFVCWSGLHRPAYEYMTSREALGLVLEARSSFQRQEWNRAPSRMESLLLDVCEADATSSPDSSLSLYEHLLEITSEYMRDCSEVHHSLAWLTKVHCLRCLSKLTDGAESCLKFAQDGLKLVSSGGTETNSLLFPWQVASVLNKAVEFQTTKCRHQVAESMIALKRYSDAKDLLEQTSKDFPKDADIAFALGAFILRMDFSSDSGTGKASKAAQIQLLKAAKLDGRKAGPFALLGYWYESQKDQKRALGCYSKALILDSTHPVAGRGLLRLVSVAQARKALDHAVQSSSPLNGWAWYSIGLSKVQDEADYNMAIVALLRAARARDIERPESDTLCTFYADPKTSQSSMKCALVAVLTTVARCYRYLGRLTACLRTYYSALEEAGEDAEPSLYCACGQVEIELGLFDEASQKFTKALQMSSGHLKLTATLGLGVSLLSIAQTQIQDGKADSALACLESAIHHCSDEHIPSSISIEKLKGDLHSFGAYLPLRAFAPKANSTDDSEELKAQIHFVSKGESAYDKSADEAINAFGMNELAAGLITDCGTNILLRAQLIQNANSTIADLPDFHVEYERAATLFLKALHSDSTFSPAWNGLGCALNQSPVLGQHAFCRAIELDKLSPDSYANLSFLYTSNSVVSPSKEISSTLTQVADTPMTWINLALLIEKEANKNTSDKEALPVMLQNAADAYRASMQVTREPSAILGVAATGALGLEVTSKKAQSQVSEWDVVRHLDEFENAAPSNIASTTVAQVMGEQGEMDDLQSNPSQTSTDLKRRLLLEPYRADLWINLAKQCITTGDASSLGSNLESAHASASKAVTILTTRLANNSHSEVNEEDSKGAPIDADLLSEALVLKAGTINVDVAEEKELSAIHDQAKTLQYAMMAAPWNRVARQALA